jgi:hypothetical protein
VGFSSPPELALAVALLGVPVRVRAPAHVAGDVRAWLEPLSATGKPLEVGAAAFEVVIEALEAGYRTTTVSGGELRDPNAVAVAVAAVTAAVVLHSPRLCVHAAVVSHPNGVLAVPGASGHGKSTLTAALLRAGFGYLSDEALAIDRRDLEVTAFPRPLSLGHDVCASLGIDPTGRPTSDHECLIRAAELGEEGRPGRITHVVLSRRDGSEVAVRSTVRSTAVSALLANSFNHYRQPESSFHVAAAVARRAEVLTARYREAGQLADLLADRILDRTRP